MSALRIIVLSLFVAPRLGWADDLLHRYEGNVHVLDESTGWIVANPCEDPCSEAVENGHFVLRWSRGSDHASYHITIAHRDVPIPPPPPTLWVEWRFRSDRLLNYSLPGLDGRFTVGYKGIVDLVELAADAVVSFEGGDFVLGLDPNDFHTYRFESLDGVFYTFSVDGLVFMEKIDDDPTGSTYLQFGGDGGGNVNTPTVNEWDFVRYGTIDYGEQVIASDPPSGLLDAHMHAGLDRFTVTYDAANYVYIDEITVETTGGEPPIVTQTRRREYDEPDTVEIVLDRPLAMGETTRFILDDGVAVNVIEYIFAPGDTDGDGDVDLREMAAFQTCFDTTDPTGPCAALDLVADHLIDLSDLPRLHALLNGP